MYAAQNVATGKLGAGPAYADHGLVVADEIGDRSLRTRSRPSSNAWSTGLPRLTLHGPRHTFATVGLDAGVDVLYVAEMLGHSSPAITQSIYQHSRQDRLVAAVETIGAEIFGGS